MRSLINKILVLIVTAMPGVQRVVLFAFIERFMGLSDLGVFSNDQFILQIISYFTALGFAGLLMVRVPKLENALGREYFARTISSSFLFSSISIFLIALLYQFGLLRDLLGAIVYIFGVGSYQLIRHFQISVKNYINLFVFDFFVLIGIATVVVINITNSILLNIGLVYLLIFVVFLINTKIKFITKILNFQDTVKSLDISGTSFFSGAVGLLLVPITNQLLGEKYTALIAMSFVILSILILIPRALGMYFLPELAKLVGKEQGKFNKIYIRFIHYNVISLILMAIIAFVIMEILSQSIYIEMFVMLDSKVLFILLLTYILSSQIAIPISSLIVAYEWTKLSLKINFITFCLSLICMIPVFLVNDSLLGVEIYMICLILLNLGRLFYMEYSVNKRSALNLLEFTK